MEAREARTKRLVAMAMEFYRSARASDARAWDTLFTALAEGDAETIRNLLEDYGIEMDE